MTVINLWDEIKSIKQKIGMSDTNFRKMKSKGVLPEKWVTPVYLELKKTKKAISLECVYRLTNQ